VFHSSPKKKNRRSLTAKAIRNRQLARGMEQLEDRKLMAGFETPPYPFADTFKLHSNAASPIKIYLDFDGHKTVGTLWNTLTFKPQITTPPFDMDGNYFSFSDTELTTIQKIWQRVAEDYLPFTVDVTTEYPGSEEALNRDGPNDTAFGMRASIGGTAAGTHGIPSLGVAFLNSFNIFGSATQSPAFIPSEELMQTYSQSEPDAFVSVITSHEVGHTLGLDHWGGPVELVPGYYAGHGFGPTSWGPIMGAADSKNLTQWSYGDYPGAIAGTATTLQDDLAVITSGVNGFGYRADDFGSTLAAATSVNFKSDGSLAVAGIIEQNTDQDWFRVELSSGPYNFNLLTAPNGPNLDAELALFDSSGNLVGINNPSDSTNATLSGNAAAGTYYLRVDGVGKFFNVADPGYSDYGSLGQYTIIGNSNPNVGTLVSGSITLDANGNSVRDNLEVGLANARVYIDVNKNNVFDSGDLTTFTDSAGNYSLNTGGLSQNLIVRAIIPNEFAFSNPVSGFQTINIGASGVGTANFFLRGTSGRIHGAKFLDTNGNGVYEPLLGETGMPGVTVYVDVNRDGIPGVGEPSMVTDANGNFIIGNVPIGTYPVREVYTPGFYSSSPGFGGQTVTITSGAVVQGIHFYNTPAIDYGDAPDTYRTRKEVNGPSHGFLYNFGLGAVDGEKNGRPSKYATGDDSTTAGFDDEQGVRLLTDQGLVTAGTTLPMNVTVSVPTGYRNGFLHAWFDFNQNGKIEADEKVIKAQQLATGTHTINVFVPFSVKQGDLFARFRYATDDTLGPVGHTLAGEVEDYHFDVAKDRVLGRDDNYTLKQGARNVALEVLNNDGRSYHGQKRIVPFVSKATDNGGRVEYDDNGTPNTFLDDVLRYFAPATEAPPAVYPKSDHFTYQITDGTQTDSDRSTSGFIDVNITLTPTELPPAPGDDFYHIPKTSGRVRLNPDVLSNDRPGTNTSGTLRSRMDIIGFETRRIVQDGDVISAGVTSDQGTVFLRDNGTPSDRSDDYFEFEPNASVVGNPTVQFRYFVANPGVTDRTKAGVGIVTIHMGPNRPDPADEAQVSFGVYNINANGTPGARIDNAGDTTVYSLTQGKDYYVALLGRDLRDAFTFANGRSANGVTNVYVDISYRNEFIRAVRNLSNVTGLDVRFDSKYTNLGSEQSGSLVVEGFIDDIGATATVASFGTTSRAANPVFYLRFRPHSTTSAAGVRLFQADPADDVNHEIFVNNDVSPFRPQQLNINNVAYLSSNRFKIVPAITAAVVGKMSAPTTSSSGTTATSSTLASTADASLLFAENQNNDLANAFDEALDDLFGA
jgi:GEVED domain/Bacterial pre-peptidase C-terminal domain